MCGAIKSESIYFVKDNNQGGVATSTRSSARPGCQGFSERSMRRRERHGDAVARRHAPIIVS